MRNRKVFVYIGFALLEIVLIASLFLRLELIDFLLALGGMIGTFCFTIGLDWID